VATCSTVHTRSNQHRTGKLRHQTRQWWTSADGDSNNVFNPPIFSFNHVNEFKFLDKSLWK
jgi:hypothetical protein